MTPEQKEYVDKELALIERGGNCDHEAFVVDRIWGMGEDNLAKVDPPVVGLCNTDDSYYIQYFKNREEIEKFIEAVKKAADEAWGPPEPVNVYPFCGVVKMPELYQAMYVGEDRISIDPVTGDVGIGSKE